ncbi:MAG: lipoate--protein ligase family protein [Chloroflexi bacterium]|jgi:lipoyl(octanoyl) transferase|nr:lipoate--protein ligase family protein [Chloroflexota bacterium]MBT3670735.1 lipoate--protein ligase family protein [Chloroflexota bacterium]MBT4003875.1 lipoate--protein ligase family protein [Chloroflexota bacterium]MBT4305103.1 lipoate--protein ligase family protein [Chloroflexota bacterium]MBT4533375.1 lipoate--protein ligase family protein [Chloroflexota bacterium]
MELPRSNWRLIKTPPASGAWNMAVDEAILQAVGRQEVPPTLRLYSWDPPCLSLGYAQSYKDVHENALSSNGWEVVRRVTGGRAILHTDELTYSVIGPKTEPRLEGGILTSYQRLSQALMLTLENLKLSVKALPKEKTPSDSGYDPVCFDVPSHYEITIDGKKLVGSAQARRKEGVLQHGTLPLSGDLTRITQALVYQEEDKRNSAAEKLLARATTIEYALGQKITWEDAANAMESAFSKELNIQFTQSELTHAEIDQSEILVTEKYGNPEWNQKI